MLLNSLWRTVHKGMGLTSVLRNLFRRKTMEVTENGSIFESHEVVTNLVGSKKGSAARDAVKEYLKAVKFPPVADFKHGQEWFNVSEPLSFNTHLKGKVVLLDFFTYCCINCMHILPDLKEIESEFSVEDGLVVIGVHSAKFDNEKVSSNILSAVQRYNISHPVVNDDVGHMWKACEVHCWPTLVLLGPDANPLVMLMGEGHKNDLLLYIQSALEFYKSKDKISPHSLPSKSAFHLLPALKGPLLFPGKITSYGDMLAISDTGNNRLLIAEESSGKVIHEIGKGSAGFADGNFEEALFNAPQGLVFQNNNILYVADTENHAVRKVDLGKKVVETVAGTGEQCHDRKGGGFGINQGISSPWDLSLYRTSKSEEMLIIAMAGTHQIWALFLTDFNLYGKKNCAAGTCACIAGSGREENRNNNYPHTAAFAQPSGLALREEAGEDEVYIADSESSSIRRLSLVNGKVSAVVGGSINPQNLFAFGDVDGKLNDAKLQHALGVAISNDHVLFIADTYNHKLKTVDITANIVTTLKTSDSCSNPELFALNEPAGLCFSSEGDKLYVADTNNHAIKVLKLNKDLAVSEVNKLNLVFDSTLSKTNNKSKFQIISPKPLTVNSNGGKLILQLDLTFANGLKLTDEAPQRWVADLPEPSWSCVPRSGSNVETVDVVINFPSTDIETASVDFVFELVTCTNSTCLPKNFIIRQPLEFVTQNSQVVESSIRISLDELKIGFT